MVVDVDSFVGQVHGRAKQGAAFGYTRVRGYHPILATRADTGEVLHIRCRTGSANTSRGMLRFCDELIARVRRAGATGPKLLRADSGFWNAKTFATLEKAGWEFSIGVRLQPHRDGESPIPNADSGVGCQGLAHRKDHDRISACFVSVNRTVRCCSTAPIESAE